MLLSGGAPILLPSYKRLLACVIIFSAVSIPAFLLASFQKGPPEIQRETEFCPVYYYPKELLELRKAVDISIHDFTPQNCLGSGGTLLLGPPYSLEWIKVNSTQELENNQYEYYFLRCETPNSQRDTTRVFPKPFKDLPLVKNDNDPNIIILLFDAVSREQFKSLFPATIAYLENYLSQPQTNHRGIVYNRYQVTGMNSNPNKKSIYASSVLDESFEKSDFLWSHAAKNGYLVTHIDGECGSLNDTLSIKQFSEYPSGSSVGIYGSQFGQPDIHYNYPARVYCDQLSRSLNYTACMREDQIIGADTHHGYVPICAGNSKTFDLELKYLEDVLSDNLGQKHFVTATFLEYHQFTWNLVQFDDSLRKFIEKLFKILPNTALFLMSDHGIHYGPEYEHDYGQIHARLPLLYPLIPNSLPKQMTDNLFFNYDKPTSHLDFYETIRNLINLNNFSTPPQRNSTGISLISGELGQRQCDEIGIPPVYCLCYQ